MRTKSKGFDDYKKKAMDLNEATSNNTTHADNSRNSVITGKLHLIRDKSLNWSKVIDGTTSHPMERLQNLFQKQSIYIP
jgi:hypothetical protein